MHYNLRPPEPRQPFLAFITTSCQVWSRWVYPLPYYSVSAADTSLYAVTLTFDFLTLTFDLWSWTCAAYRLWRDETTCMCQIWTQPSKSRRSCDLNIWPNCHCVTCCTRLWDNFHKVWPLTTYPCLNYGVFMLIRHVKLWPWPLTPWPWKIRQASRYQSLYKAWTKSSNPRLNYW